MPATIRPAGPADLPDVAALFRVYAEGLGVDLGFQGFEAELAALPGPYAPPQGALLIARDGLAALGCVAMRPHASGICEMKRLYVAPCARGQALGRRLADAIMAEARAAGYRRMVLDTLGSLTVAVALYRGLGFRAVPPYYDNPLPGVIYMECDLAGG